ncbi:hypothetical protein PTKIN_Ptkin12aG0180300 [Pterospermum kingtungense]
MASDDGTVYVAVGGDEERDQLILLWTLHNLRPPKICILHVHQPPQIISSFALLFDPHQLRGLEEDTMHQIMDEYLHFCSQAEVSAISLYIQRDDVAKGIVELIGRHNIKKLVMGAAADQHFSERMWHISGKAQYVNENAPPSCQIWFICGERLIGTRFETGESSNTPSPSGSSYLTSSSDAAPILDSTIFEEREQSEFELEPFVLLHPAEEGSSNDQLYEQLEQALQEVESSNKKASEESERRVKAELNAVRAMRQAKAFERLYNECKRDLENMKCTNSEYRIKQLEDQLQISQKQRDDLQVELENSRKVTDELLRKQQRETSEIRDATLEQLQICQKEKDELRVELENTRKITEELFRKQDEDTSSTHMQTPFTEFSPSEIQEATEEFDPSYKIADGTRGSVYYKCVLRHTEVAIKVLGQNGLQGLSEFQQEVDELSKSRHPNLLTLIGACPEIRALIYEYVPNGSLEDRLNCRNETPLLSVQTRIRIATELCCTLMFLHSSKPESLVHGNLKPGNILLDANFGCKLSDFGANRALSILENSSIVSPYLDPDFQNTGRLSRSLDVYPFGVILLQLLSGRSTQGIAEAAQNAVLNGGNLSSFLDSSAGTWPHQVAQLTHLAIRCCDVNRCRRPDLASEVLVVLETMRPSSGASSSPSYLPEPDEDSREPPDYFLCPILQVVMSDPHVAADGHTYEATALQEWLADHETSPMTNLRLPNHNLIPNYPLRSAIQQWRENRH